MTGKGSAKRLLESAEHLKCFPNLGSGYLSCPFSKHRGQFLQGHTTSCFSCNLWFSVQNARPSQASSEEDRSHNYDLYRAGSRGSASALLKVQALVTAVLLSCQCLWEARVVKTHISSIAAGR